VIVTARRYWSGQVILVGTWFRGCGSDDVVVPKTRIA
jgi:hypothetical protein